MGYDGFPTDFYYFCSGIEFVQFTTYQN